MIGITLYYKKGNTLERFKPGKLLIELPTTSDDDPFIMTSRNDGGNFCLLFLVAMKHLSRLQNV